MTNVLLNIGLYIVLVPALTTGIILAAAWQPWRDETWLGGYWGGALALGVGYLTIQYTAGGQIEGMPYLIAGIVVIGLIQPLLRDLGAGARWVVRLTVPYALVYFVIAFKFREGSGWSGGEAILWWTLMALLVAAAEWTLETIAERHAGATAPLLMIVLSMGGSAVLVLIAVASFSELMGVVTVTASVAFVLSLWDAERSMARGGVTVFTLLFAALFVSGFFLSYDDPSPVAGLGLALAPHALWIGEIDSLESLEGWKGAALRALLVLPPIGGAALAAQFL